MNRLSAALLAVLTVTALAACGNDDSNGNSNGNGSSPVTTTALVAQAAVKISPQEGQALMDSLGAELTVIDVRTPDEFASGHIAGAVNIDLDGGGFSAAIGALDPTKAYIVYCHSGRRAAIAADTMVAAGFTGVRDMGGIADWVAAGLPVVTG